MAATLAVLATTGDAPEARNAAIREAVEAFESLAPLGVAQLSLCQRVHAFGHYDAIEPGSLRAGQPVIVYCEMAGLRYEPAPGGFRSRLASRVELRPPGEETAVWSADLGTAEDLCVRRRRDFYVNYRVTLPETLPPGPFDLVLIQTDLAATRSATATLAVEIHGATRKTGTAPTGVASASGKP